jgi:hypothetical protein
MLKWGRSIYIDLSLENIAYVRGLMTMGETNKFASSRNMVVGSTMFENKDTHKRTWKCV